MEICDRNLQRLWFSRDNGKFAAFGIKRGPGDISKQIIDNKAAFHKFTCKRFGTEILQPVINGTGSIGLDDSKLIERHLLLIIFKSIQKSVIFMGKPKAAELVFFIYSLFFPLAESN